MPSDLPPVSPHLGVIRTLQRPRREFVTVSAPPAARNPGPATAVAAPWVTCGASVLVHDDPGHMTGAIGKRTDEILQ